MPFENQTYRLSYWEYESYLRDIDFLIVGAGIVGLITALKLKITAASARIVIMERSVIGAGASTRNAGFACIGSLGELVKDNELYGSETVLEMVKMRFEGLSQLKSLVGGRQMNYRDSGGFELFRSREEYESRISHMEEWNRRIHAVTGLEQTYTIQESEGIRGFYPDGIKNNAEGLLDTGLMYKELYKQVLDYDIPILRGIEIVSYDKIANCRVDVMTDQFSQSICTKNLLICTNAFTRKLMPNLEVIPCRNQVIVTSPVDNDHVNTGCHIDNGHIYFRSVGERVLIGGARHLFPEENDIDYFGLNHENQIYLTDLLRESIIPDQSFTIDYEWSGILCGGTNRTPLVQQVESNIYVGIRLGGMGVAIGSSIANELVELALQ